MIDLNIMRSAAFAAALTGLGGEVHAASIDLQGLGLGITRLLFEAKDLDIIVFDGGLFADNVLSVNTAALSGVPTFKMSLSIASIDTPDSGSIVAFDSISLEALINQGGVGGPVLARLLPGVFGALDYADGFVDSGATLQVFELRVVPLPAAAPLLAFGATALGLLGARRRARA